ncbi:RiPP maturation radical SAM C-methyltransferase [Phaeobacter sp. QD34_3]|uniref:RiPP maturation radical SAM C-methyltransferase n=1 Tax=unclassified Phaeobacter TaxID=2621772 RepID=UPI00237F37CA|nr:MULTISPECIES: RiPP maturation radical SAM C-methyltransferase [unclassified Phaeobacter]MDE4133245.1 RiPP maturation radical SAM C-methyltransferase [Phaeobacter sp. QD34_3]MDE4136968.1 RiPP maturation radical SAM C-methyltransferase [Phaeobacter sp. QD34_24]
MLSLISLPWRSVRVPPIDIGSLAAYLRQEEPGWDVDLLPAFLDGAETVGMAPYEAIAVEAEKNCLGDCFFTGRLFPERAEAARVHFLDAVGWMPNVAAALQDLPVPLDQAFDHIGAALERTLMQVLDRLQALWAPRGRAPVVGLTTTYTQLFSSLYFARLLKSRFPGAVVILGGTNVGAKMGPTILASFEEVDFIVQGEGEAALLALLRGLQQGRIADIPGVLSRQTGGKPGRFTQLPDLDSLPVPEYDSYYAHPLIRSAPQWAKAIAVEASRGCVHKCSFCSVPTEWAGYRFKSPQRIRDELAALADRYGVAWFYFMDNDLPGPKMRAFADAIEGAPGSFRFAIPFRATVTPYEILRMHDAGLETAQLGIEGFSNAYLKRLNKRTTVIHNLQAMKTFFELEIVNYGNLLVGYPGTTQEEVDDNRRIIADYAYAYQTLFLAVFQLHLGSGADQQRAAHGIYNVRNDDYYATLLPNEINAGLCLYQLSWDERQEGPDWSGLVQTLETWREVSEGRIGERPFLQYHDLGRSLVIEDQRGRKPRQHRLQGAERDLYLWCCQIRHLAELRRAGFFAEQEDLRSTLCSLVERKLIYREGDRYLSLAVAPDPRAAARRIRAQEVARGNRGTPQPPTITLARV